MQTLFGLPTLMLPAGTGDDWPLDAVEEKLLTQRIQDVLDMMPKKKKSAMMKFLSKYMPPLALLGTAGMIIAPRVQSTREKLSALKAHRSQPIHSPPSDDSQGITIRSETNVADDIAGPADRSDGRNAGSVSDAVSNALVYQETV